MNSSFGFHHLVKEVAESLYPIYVLLISLAAQANILSHDDTSVKILDLLQENKKELDQKRPGIHTTGVLAQAGKHKIALFFSGRQHAGENLRDLLQQREKDLPPPLQVCDASSSNTIFKSPKQLFATVGPCGPRWLHRKFNDLKVNFPEESQFVLDKIKSIYKSTKMMPWQKKRK